MKILLINNNPVVSRLTALSARKEDIEIDEIQEVTELSSDTYDIVFVDAESWTKDVRDVISENINTKKSVLFYADGDDEEKSSFDLSILKPFLPSEVSAVIRSIETDTELVEETATSNTIDNFDIISDAKESSREELFTLDDLEKVEEKKEVTELLDDKNEKMSFDDKLEEVFPLSANSLDDDLFNDEPKIELELKDEIEVSDIKKTPKNESNDELFDLDLSDEVPSLENDLFTDNKDDKKEELVAPLEELESFDPVLESSEELEVTEIKPETVKTETKILDETEIDTIKGILTEETDNDMTLEDLMPPLASTSFSQKAAEAELDETSLDTSVLAQTLSAMPVESLRELLAGAKVNIKIKFPKSKK